MTREEINDLSRYFILIQYRDAYHNIKPEELEELNAIIARNIIAQDLEAAKHLHTVHQFSDEAYAAVYNSHYYELLTAINEQNILDEKKNGPTKAIGGLDDRRMYG